MHRSQLRKGITLIRFIIYAVVGTIILSAIGIGVSNVQYSNGIREGHLQKLSKKGLVWNTWEGELALFGFSTRQDSLGQTEGNLWSFTIEDEKLAQQILQYSQPGGNGITPKLRMEYIQYLSSKPWRGSSAYIVNKVVIYGDSPVVLEKGKDPVLLKAK